MMSARHDTCLQPVVPFSLKQSNRRPGNLLLLLFLGLNQRFNKHRHGFASLPAQDTDSPRIGRTHLNISRPEQRWIFVHMIMPVKATAGNLDTDASALLGTPSS
jgi:hypothetical protein